MWSEEKHLNWFCGFDYNWQLVVAICCTRGPVLAHWSLDNGQYTMNNTTLLMNFFFCWSKKTLAMFGAFATNPRKMCDCTRRFLHEGGVSLG